MGRHGVLRGFPEPAPAKLLDAKDPEPWIRTALFGTADQLLKLLDGGLDADAKTSNGTTLLMMAAPDAAKVRLLIARGGNVKARGTSGHDALTIASAYRGTTASLRVLLDAGADASPPDDVHVRRPPLVFAAMAGDAANVKCCWTVAQTHPRTPRFPKPLLSATATSFGS